MPGTRAVAYLAAGIFEMGGFCNTDKSTRLPVTCGMAWIALLDFLRGQVLHLTFNALKGNTFFRIGAEIFILVRMTVPAGQ